MCFYAVEMSLSQLGVHRKDEKFAPKTTARQQYVIKVTYSQPFHPILLYKDYLHYTPRSLQYVNLSKHSNLTNPFYLIYYFPLIPTGNYLILANSLSQQPRLIHQCRVLSYFKYAVINVMQPSKVHWN
jgi:hypothetical protein